MPSPKTWLSFVRKKLAARHIERRLEQTTISMISDDCWGGFLYEELGLKCRSPFVGMGFRISDYLDFLVHMREPGALDVISVATHEKDYPLLQTKYALMHGLHYRTIPEFKLRFERRTQRINWDHIYIKIDLGKRKYRWEDVERWNDLKLPRSVAFYPDEARFRDIQIHNGVCVPDWIDIGMHIYHRSCHAFDLIHWLNTGEVTSSRRAALTHALLFDHDHLRHIRRKLFKDAR